MAASPRRSFVTRLLDKLFDLRAATRGPASRLGRGLERLEARDVPAAVPFGLPQSVLSGVGYPYTTAAADLNGDGRADVLAAATDGSAIVWAANLGDGVFGPKQTIAPGSPSEFVVNTYAVDFDGDADPDVLAAGDDILRLYLNDGTGTFAAPLTIASAGTFRAAFAADLDGDGDTDVATITNTAVGSSSGGTAAWYRNDGANAFTLAQSISTAFDGPRAAVALDADGDGDTDLVVGANRDNKVVLFRNDGAGVFGPEELVTTDIAGIRNLYAADLNADGHADLVSVAYGSSEVAWYANDGTGAFAKAVISNVPAGFFAAAVGDIDGNGTPDVVAAGFDDSSVSWFANDGAGNFGPRQVISAVPGGGGLLAVGVGDFNADGRPDVVAGDTTDPYRVAVYENRTGRFSTVVIPPAGGRALVGQAIDVKVHFGVPVAVTGAPEIDLNVGGTTRVAAYVAGSGTPVLTFRYVVTAADVDPDGVELTSAAVRLAGGTLTDPDGNPVNRNLPAADLSGTTVNGSAPLVTTITRLDANPTNGREVRFAVTFSEAVTGVTAADFGPVGPLTGAAVTGVTGAGASYTVTVSTGTGSGALGLAVNDGGAIADAAGNALGLGFNGGEVYTLQRRPARTIDTFFTDGHGDIGVGFEGGALDPHVHTDALGELAADGVLIVAEPDALRTTPVGPEWAFLGAGAESYLLAESENPALPYLGIAAEEVPGGTLASYPNADPRVGATGAWVKLQLVGYRGPAGAHFSVYNSGSPDPTVWMATSDGIGAGDSVFVLQGSHGHFNFAFSAAGNYEVDLVASGFLDANGNGTYDPGIDPYTESGVTTYYFQIDPSGGPTPVDLPADELAPVAPVPFGQKQILGSGLGGASSTTAADLDGDGDLDLLTGAYGAGRMVWFENLGGSFGPERLIDTIDSVWFAVPGDLDGDGDIDAIASGYSGVLSWYANDGAGNFGPAQLLDPAASTPNIALADFDGDGRLDILGAPDFSNDVRFYRALPGGGFAGPVTLVADIQNSIGLEARDFDGDGDIDLAYGEFSTDSIHIYLNQGGGVLGPRNTMAAGPGPGVFGYADFDGDGLGDLLSLEFGSGGGLSWYSNNGDGTFGGRNALPEVPGGPYARGVADVNGDGTIDVLSGTFSSNPHLVWLPNLGNGTFGPALVISQGGGQSGAVVAADFDGDGDADFVAASFSLGEVQYFENRTGEFATEVIPPANGTYLAGYQIDVSVHYGFPVAVTGTPQLDLDIGGAIRTAEYVSGAGTPTLTFRYVVVAADLDLNGIALASSAVGLNGGTITDPAGNPVDLSLPGANLSGVKVNGSAPSVASVVRLDANPTSAGTVRFAVTFSEAVTGVDGADFGLAATGGLTGAVLTGVSGSGAVYTVTVATGTGSGTVGLEVPATASISDAQGNRLGAGFSGGEVFTLNRRPARTIDNYYEQGHGDIEIVYADGEWDAHVERGPVFAPDEVLIYGNETALRTTPVGPQWAFLGAGVQSYYWPQSGSANPDVPELGISGEGMQSGALASYFNSDPRVNAAGAWVRFQVVGVRGPAGANFSIYSSGDVAPTVWVATSDGLTAEDSVYFLEGSHNHFNFAFTAAGLYAVDVVASGFRDTNGNGTYEPGIDAYTEGGVTTFYMANDLPGGPQPLSLPADPLPPAPPPVPVPFGLLRPVTTLADGAFGVVAADLDGDGDLDLASVSDFDGKVAWYENLGGGVFGPQRLITDALDGAFSIAAGDLNGDGRIDLVATGSNDDRLLWFANNGDGTFTSALISADPIGLREVKLADLDGDGDLDVLVAGAEGSVVWFRNNGSGTFTPNAPIVTDASGARSVFAADLDGDGKLDVLLASARDRKVSWFANTGTGFGPRQVIAEVSDVRSVWAADFDGDGKPDVLYGSGDGIVAVARNTGGAFAAPVTLTTAANGVRSVSAADLDGDGDQDVLSASFADGKVAWYQNLGGGVFGPQLVISTDGLHPVFVAAADLDGDGDQDVFAAQRLSGRVALFENRLGEFATAVVAPPAGLRTGGQTIDVAVNFGFPVAVTGAPSLALRVGDQIVTGVYLSGSGTSALTFRYVVAEADRDADGVELASSAVALNGGSIADLNGRPVNLSLPNASLPGVTVNGSAPAVRSVARVGAPGTNAGAVTFRVTFSEAVVGVDPSDFGVVTGGDLAGTAVTGVTGSGAEYLVTVTTGTGSGLLGLKLPAGASVSDAAGNPLGAGFTGGEVFTLLRRPARTIGTFYEREHGDLDIGFENGAIDLKVHSDALGDVFAPDRVVIYGGPAGLRDTPTGPEFAFLGAGARSYVFPEDGSNAEVPDLGVAAEDIAPGTFASYLPADPRVTNAAPWLTVRLVGFRGPAGGQFSVYSSGDSGPTVWMATSDGIGATDLLYAPEGSHNHYNFAFTTPGVYEVDVVASGFLDTNGNGTYDPAIDTYTESGVTTYYFAIDLPGGPAAVTIPADPLPVDPIPPTPPAPRPVAHPVAVSTPAGGTVWLTYSDGSTTTVAPFPGFTGPVRTATADMNGDGVADLVAAVGGGAAPHVKVLDGKTGAELMSFFAYGSDFTGGVSVAVGDVTGDGVPDIVTGAGTGAGPHVKVFDGRTGAEVRSFFAYDAGFTGGVSVAAADLDGDGKADIVTGTLTGAPHVKAFDGATGAERLSFYAYDAAITGGVFVAAGDLDGDGRAEVVTGTGAGGGSHVKLFDGRTGTERGGFMAYAESFRGGVRVAVTDTDGDGLAEVVTGAGPGGGPHVRVFDGRTLAVVDEFMAGDPTLFDGVFVG